MREIVTVVSGVPRSGTSLVMQMLRAGGMPLLCDGVRAADADNPRGYLELEAVKRTARDASWVSDAGGRAVKVIHALVPSLPEGPTYRLLLVERSWGEVLASQRTMLERAGTPEDGLSDARLAELYRAGLDAVRRWSDAHDVARLELRHAHLLSHPHDAAVAIAHFLACDLDIDAMAAAVDPSLHRQR